VVGAQSPDTISFAAPVIQANTLRLGGRPVELPLVVPSLSGGFPVIFSATNLFKMDPEVGTVPGVYSSGRERVGPPSDVVALGAGAAVFYGTEDNPRLYVCDIVDMALDNVTCLIESGTVSALYLFLRIACLPGQRSNTPVSRCAAGSQLHLPDRHAWRRFRAWARRPQLPTRADHLLRLRLPGLRRKHHVRTALRPPNAAV
jgi:hypothetical protein